MKFPHPSNVKARFSFHLVTVALFGLLLHGAPSPAAPSEFNGAVADPMGAITESVTQLRIEFPEELKKSSATSIEVTCSPSLKGFAGWADNNRIWTFDFKAENEYETPQLVGGSKCTVKQVADLQSISGKTWKAGQIQYQVIRTGPNVTSAIPAAAFKGALRETEPVILMTFDGPVDEQKFFAGQNGVVTYLSANAPSEKISLAPVPQDQKEKIFEFFKMTNMYSDLDPEGKDWILATIKQNLVPGAQVKLSVSGATSALNPDVQMNKVFTKEFSVRSQFQAEVTCQNPSAKDGSCLPRSPIFVALNGMVRWADLRDAYIEYVPFGSQDRKTVRSFIQIEEDRKIGFWDLIINYIAQYFPYVAKYSDTVLDSAVFKVDIEPETQAKVVLPMGLVDLEGRALSNVLTEFYLAISAMDEYLRVPQQISFFERKVSGVYLPISLVNQNQNLKIRKSGGKDWTPVTSPEQMIQVLKAYESLEEYRETPDYTSPLETLNISSQEIDHRMTGEKNRPNVMQVPFASNAQEPASGLYVIEVSSAAVDAAESNPSENQYRNPRVVLAQVTDLSLQMKRGEDQTLVWLTRLSDASVVGGAELKVFNCRGELVTQAVTDSQGLAKLPGKVDTVDCEVPENQYSPMFRAGEFFVSAQVGTDLTVVSSAWMSWDGYALSAPGVDWFSTNIEEGKPYFHAIIGVNLVKPGQLVPIEIVARKPEAQGFSTVASQDLPAKARLVNWEDDDIYYEFPLTWNSGRAEIQWRVPGDASAVLGRYLVQLVGANSVTTLNSSDIEVAEFKVPLMSGVIGISNQELVRPDQISVNTVIRYANGVGAKSLKAEMAYFFVPASVENEKYPGFEFGTGLLKFTDTGTNPAESALPKNSRPAVIQGLSTAQDGSLIRDLATENVSDGRTVSEVLKVMDRPQRLVVRVRYQDQMGEYQTLSQSKMIYNSPSYVGTKLVTGARAQARLLATHLNVDGKNLTDLKDLDIKVVRIETRVIGEELFGGLIKNTLEREIKPVRWTANCSLVAGIAQCAVGTLREGSYAFQVTSKSSQQSAFNLFKVDTNGRVFGPNEYFNFGDDEGQKQMPLAQNKETYKNGDTAILSFSAPFKSCSALVTLERNNVLESFVVNQACEKGQVQVPVRGEWAPNVFVSVYAVTGRAPGTSTVVGDLDLGRPTYRLGFANLKVNWENYKAEVKVATDKAKYEPGQTVEVEVDVYPALGSLKGGSVTLIAIEDKILELKENDTYKILEALMQMREHSVRTITVLNRIETVTKENGDLRAAPRKGGDEGGDGGSAAEFKRKLFDALVSFQTQIPVIDGKAKASFKTNDSLTRFKVIAVAVDEGHKFGYGEVTYLSEKDTQSYSNIPSVARTGDQFPAKVTVQNNGTAANDFKVVIVARSKDSSGKLIDEKTLTKSHKVEASGSQAIDVGGVTIHEDAARVEYVIRVYDGQGRLVDVMEPEAQIILPAVPMSVQENKILQVENGSLVREFEKDRNALPGRGELRLIASNSLVLGALDQIQQKIQRDPFADLFTEYRLYKALVLGSEKNPGDLPAAMQALLASVDSQGFVKYSPRSQKGSLYLTASVMHALQENPWALKHLPGALVAKWQQAVTKVLGRTVEPSYVGKSEFDWMRAQVAMARAAFLFADPMIRESAMALNKSIDGELAKNAQAYGAPMSQWSTGLLLNKWMLEIHAGGVSAKNSKALQVLLSPARLIYTGNMAKLNGSPAFDWVYSDETIESAQLLLGLSKVGADAQRARALALGLVNVSAKGWYNSATVVNVHQSLKAFGQRFESDKVEGVTVVAVPQQQASAVVDFGKQTSGGLVTPWTEARATAEVKHTGKGRPWVSLTVLAAVPLQQPVSQGISIDKSLKNLTRDTGFEAGDLIEVTLMVNANSGLAHVAVMDPIPAGANIVGEAYGDYSSGQKSYSGYKLYFESLARGVTEVRYQYQLNNPGKFKLAPTRAEGVYLPSVFGETPNADIVVK